MACLSHVYFEEVILRPVYTAQSAKKIALVCFNWHMFGS